MLRPETATARRLRRQMSLPEVLLWQRLKGGQTGLKFRKQHPIGPYIVDFYCSATRAVVEVDGEVHGTADRPARDATRDAFLTGNGYHVIRVMAATILADADDAASSIAALAANPLHPRFAAVPLPASGEDREIP